MKQIAEEWRVVPGYEPYEASSLGRIRRGAKVLRGWLRADGYRAVSTSHGQVPIHTLVLTAFVGPRPSPKHTVAHGDGRKLNNVSSNLRWATMVEQYEDRRRHGTDVRGERHPLATITREIAAEIRRLYVPRSRSLGGRALAKRFRITPATVYNVVCGDAWQ